jgi:hypothetical protein
MDKRIMIAGFSAAIIGIIVMLILVKLPPNYWVIFAINPTQLSINYAFVEFVGLFITGIDLIIVGSIVGLTGLFLKKSNSHLNRRKFFKGLILVASAFPISTLFFLVVVWVTYGFDTRNNPIYLLGYGTLFIPLAMFIIGCFKIYEAKQNPS